MTLETQQKDKTLSIDLSNIEWTSTELRDDFRYYLELLRSGERHHEMIRNQTIRIGAKIAEKFFKYGQPGMCKTIPTIFTGHAHKHGIYAFDDVIKNTFKTSEWLEALHKIEQSYSHYRNEYENLLEQFSRGSGKSKNGSSDDVDQSCHNILDNLETLPPDKLQTVISKIDRIQDMAKTVAIRKNVAVPPSESETAQTQTESVEKKEDQVKTPQYKIKEDHLRRQKIVADGLFYFEQRLKDVRENVLPKTPIESDEQAERWRNALMQLADNFAALGDNKHRMDFKNWAETFINIEKYGPEKGLKMSGYNITPHDLEMIDEDTLPLNWNEKHKAVELSYISKEHLDSKGHIIANIFIDYFNSIPALAEMSEMFSYQAKLRGIRALQVSQKLSNNK